MSGSIFLQRGAAGNLAAILGIAAVTAICVPFHDHLNDTFVAMAFLLTVLFVALLWGIWPGRISAALGMLCYDYFFLQPIHSFAIDRKQDWIALAAFLITASTVGHLSTREKRRAAEAEASADEIRDLYNHAPCGYHSLDKEGVFIRINDTELEWLGYTREEVIGKRKLTDFLTPEGLRTFARVFPQLKAEGAIADIEFELVRKSGPTLPVLLSATAVMDQDGNYAMSRAAVYDITARKREEQVHAQLAAIVEFCEDAIFSQALDGRVLTWNKAAERMFGYTAEEMRERPMSVLLPPGRLDEWQGVMDRLQHGESTQRLETVLAGKDGRPIDISLTLSPIRDADARIVRVSSIARDVTERKRAEEALQSSESNLKRAQEIAHIGSWYLDVPLNRLTWSDEIFRMFGVPPGTGLTYDSFAGMIHAEDRERVDRAWAAALRGAPYDIEHRIFVGGAMKWVRERAEVEFDRDGNAVRGIGTVQDITERKRAENEIGQLARRQATMAALGQEALRSDGLSDVLDRAAALAAETLDVECCAVWEVLPAGGELLLRSGVGWKEGLIGQATVGAGAESEAGFALHSQAPAVVEDWRTEKRFLASGLLSEHGVVSGMSVAISTGTGPYGVLGAHTKRRRTFTEDEVEFLQAIANVLSMTIERRRAADDLLRINRAHRALSSCNEALIRATDETALLQQICQIIVDEAGYRLCWAGYAEQDEAKSVRPVGKAGFDEGYLQMLHLTWADTERGRGPTGACIRTGTMQVTKNIATDPKLALWRAEAQQRGYASAVAIPLVADAKVLGALTIYSSEIEAFGEEELKLLAELAGDLGFGIETLRTRAEHERAENEIRTLNAELEQRVAARTAELRAANEEIEQAREREIEIGFKIQQNLLLDQPPSNIPGLRVAALTIPSQRIDGDFYIFIRHSDDCLDVIVGDVMGKGIPAALLGAATKSHFLKALSDLMVLAKDGKLPAPKEIVMLAHANLARHLIELDSFVTLVYARFDVNERRLDFVDCGHTGVIQLHGRTGLSEILHGDNLPLGVRVGEIYDEVSVSFEPGDFLLFYSDGITEARNPAGEFFGEERLESIAAHHRLEPSALVEAIRKEIFAFSGTARLNDDLTIMAIRVEERLLPVMQTELAIGSELRELRRARAFVRESCRELLDEESVCALELAVNEAASNIMKHAYKGRPDQWIHLEAEGFPSHVSIRLHHLGEPFDPSTAPAPALDGSRESGFGAYIIARSVDEVRYHRDERGRNCIALVKFRKSPEEGKKG